MIHTQVERIEEPHDLALAADGAERQTAADELAEHRQIGRDAQRLLQPTARHAEGLHFIEHEDGAGRVRRLDDFAEELRLRTQHAARAEHRLEKNTGDVATMRFELLAELRGVVELGDERMGPGLVHRAKLKFMDDAVVARAGHQELAAPGSGARDLQREVRGLAPRIGEAHFVDGGDASRQALGELHLVEIVGRPGRALGDTIVHDFDHRAVRVPVDERGVVVDQVDVFVSIRVPDAAALAVRHRDRVRKPVRRLARCAARENLQGALVVLRGARRALDIAAAHGGCRITGFVDRKHGRRVGEIAVHGKAQ